MIFINISNYLINYYIIFLLKFIDSGLNVVRDGHAVSRRSDFIIYSVEAENIGKVVAEYGPCK